MRSHALWQLSVTGIALGLSTACTEVPEKDDNPPQPIVATLDSSSGVVPSPSDFLLSVDPAGQSHDADRQFFAYLQSIGGLTPTSAVSVPFTVPAGSGIAEIPASAIAVLPLTEHEAPGVSAAYNPATTSVNIAFDAPTQPGSRYAIAVLGSTAEGGLSATDGRAVTAPTPIFFSRSEEPLVDFAAEDTCAAPTPEGVLHINHPILRSQFGGVIEEAKAEPPATPEAQAELAEALTSLCLLEGLRLQYAPLWDGVEAAGLRPDDVAMLFTLSTADVTIAELNSDTGRIPTPNNLVLTQDLSALPAGADKDFFTFLIEDLGGFPPTNAIDIPFSGPIAETSIRASSLPLLALSGDPIPATSSITFDTADNTIDITLESNISRGTRLAGVVTNDLTDTNGNPVAPPVEFVFMKSLDPLVTLDGGACDGEAITADMIPSTVLRAQLAGGGLTGADICTLEGARASFAPLFDTLAASGTPRDEIVMAYVTDFPDRTVAAFDPAAGIIGFPNAFLVDQETGLVNLPIPEDAPDGLKQLFGGLNTLDGFTTLGNSYSRILNGDIGTEAIQPFTHYAAAEVNPDDTSDVIVLNSDPNNLDVEVFYKGYDADNPDDGRVFVKPLRPFGENKLIIVGLFNTLEDTDGQPLAPDSAFVFLRSAHPLVDENGNSLVSALDDATAAALEVARANLETVFDTFEGSLSLLTGNKKRPDVVQLYVYETQTITDPLVALRGAAYQIAQSLSIPADSFTSAGTPQAAMDVADFASLEAPFQDGVGCVVPDAVMTSVNFLNGPVGSGTFAVDGDGNPVATTEDIGVIIAAPDVSTGPCQGQTDLPVIIFGHGLTANRRDVLAVASTFAEQCYVTIGIDMPEHGGRDPDASSLHPDLAEINALEAAGMYAENIFSLNLFAVRDAFRQGALDLVQLNRLIRGGALSAALDNATCGNIAVDGTDVSFVGLSFGVLIGTTFLAIEPTIPQAALAAGGGRITTIITESQSQSFGESVVQLIEGFTGAQRDTAAFDEFLSSIQWVLDPADPANFANHILGDTLTDALTGDPIAPKDILILETLNDPTVPNSSTEYLEAALAWGQAMNADGDPTSDYAYEAIQESLGHSAIKNGARLTDTARQDGTICTQVLAMDYLTAARSGSPALSTDSRTSDCRAAN